MTKKTTRCVGTDRGGVQCGRRVAGNVRPALCHLHARDATPVGVIANQATDDPAVILQRLMKDRDPAIRLRAVSEWIDYQRKQEKGCPQCAARTAEHGDREDMLTRLTQAQRDSLADLIRQVNTVTTRASTQPVVTLEQRQADYAAAHPMPVTYTAPPRAVEDSTPEPIEVAPPVVEDTSPRLTLLPHELWEAAGLIEMDNHAVTHPLGDEHAQLILTGAIPFEDASAQHDADQRTADGMKGTPSHWSGTPDGRRP